MSQQPTQTVIIHAPPSNGLGTAGFIVSLISFFLCGLTSPLGLMMSLVALFFRPRGMAAAGVLLGALGSWWLFAGGMAIIAAIGGLIGLANAPPPESASPPSSPPSVATVHESITSTEMVADTPQTTSADETEAADLPQPQPAEPAVDSPPEVATPPQPETDESDYARLQELRAERDRREAAARKRFRTWTTADGKFSVDAEFVYVIRDSVKLRRLDGKEITVPLERLSDVDRDWIEARQTRGK